LAVLSELRQMYSLKQQTPVQGKHRGYLVMCPVN